MDCTVCWGSHLHWFWIMPFLFMILMFVFAIRMIRRTGNSQWCFGNRTGWKPFDEWKSGQGSTVCWWPETPLQVLNQRYASGEITKAQYEQMKRDIDSQSLEIYSCGYKHTRFSIT